MKKLLLLLVAILTLFILNACCKHMVVYSGELQQEDTIFIVPVPGYSYNVTVEKLKGEEPKAKYPPAISTSSGKIVNIPEEGDISEVLFLSDTTLDNNIRITFTDQDTIHIWCRDTGEWQFIDCETDETINAYCGDNMITLPCQQGMVVEFR